MSGVIIGEDGCRYMKINEFGQQMGKSWDDGAGGRVKHISIYYDDVIYSIQTIYERETAVMSQRHGGNEGSFEMIEFTEEDPLTWVSGYAIYSYADNKYTRIITSLSFGTAKQTYGPFGGEIGRVPFSFKSATEICGFHGWSTEKLHAIGVYIRCPATRVLGEEPSCKDTN